MAGALAELSVHLHHSVLLLVAAGAFARSWRPRHAGPLGIARLCGPRAHATLDVFVPSPCGLAPILPALRPEPIAIVVVELAVVAWLRVGTLTRYTRPPVAPTQSAPTQSAPTQSAPTQSAATTQPATTTEPASAAAAGVGSPQIGATPAPATGADTGTSTGAATYAPALARGLGILAGRTARRLPDADAALRRGAHEAGRHLPGAEAALRRGARYAARRAARLTRPGRDAAP